MSDRRRHDPTRVRNQAALRTSTGRIWLVVGAIIAAVCVAVLLVQIRGGAPLAVLGAIVVVLLYVAMVIVRFVLPPSPRLVVLACFFTAIPAWTIVWLIVIVAHTG